MFSRIQGPPTSRAMRFASSALATSWTPSDAAFKVASATGSRRRRWLMTTCTRSTLFVGSERPAHDSPFAGSPREQDDFPKPPSLGQPRHSREHSRIECVLAYLIHAPQPRQARRASGDRTLAHASVR